ncbi:MAG: DUF1501 domain-containing protein, partial [Planctomycetaceae bacterium]
MDHHPSTPHFPTSTTRREFLQRAGGGFGAIALASLLTDEAIGAKQQAIDPLAAHEPHFAPRAKRVIWLFMHGGPSHVDLFDYKPQLQEHFDKDLPDSVRMGQRLTTMTSGQQRFPIAP